ncbi:MAG: hypothetical protein BroJett015_03610 [Chloroflexota bacterium]|nr:MAG: hypothetical protein BroJett015_03610 [Chloroflexota bacterium]
MQDVDLLKMQARWRTLTGALGVDAAAAQPVFAELVAQYEGNGRAYHNLTHVRQVLASAMELADEAVDWTAVQLAIWFHDVVYVPGAPDNESQSARFARRILHGWQLPDELIDAVEQLILATALNGTIPDHPDVSLIQDADIATLGWPPDAYRRYAQAIRREFAHVPEEAYRHGRSQILTYFLQQERLYRTDHFFTRLEKPARTNLQQELMELGN